MPFHAYIDDSGSEPTSPVYVLAGFIASDDEWTAFAVEWQHALDEPPSLEYFKMSEAARLRGQFDKGRGWTESKRDDRLISLARVIRKHARVRVSAWLRHEDFEAHIKTIHAPVRRLASDNAYVMLFMQIILATAVFADRHGISEACNFVFDEQGSLGEEAAGWWPNFKWIVENSTRSDLRNFVGSKPVFSDEKNTLPLQAADLYAWQVRHDYVVNHKIKNQTIKFPATKVLRVLGEMPAINREYSTEEILRLRQHLLETGKRFAEQFPDLPLLPPIVEKRERRKAHRKARKSSQRL